jgi:hypothetical protein
MKALSQPYPPSKRLTTFRSLFPYIQSTVFCSTRSQRVEFQGQDSGDGQRLAVDNAVSVGNLTPITQGNILATHMVLNIQPVSFLRNAT